MNKFFKLLGFDAQEKQTSVKTEIIAGIVTFLAMAYILTVNPNQILYAGTADPRWSSLFIATAFGAIIGTLLMAFLAKMPLAQASGMGLNSLVGSIIGGGIGFFAYGFSFSIGQASRPPSATHRGSSTGNRPMKYSRGSTPVSRKPISAQISVNTTAEVM